MKTDIWPACQFNFVWLDENPTRTITLDDQTALNDYVPFPGSGLVKLNWMGSRVLITTTTPQHKQVEHFEIFKTRLRSKLVELGILID